MVRCGGSTASEAQGRLSKALAFVLSWRIGWSIQWKQAYKAHSFYREKSSANAWREKKLVAAGVGWGKIGKSCDRGGAEVRLRVRVPVKYRWACSHTRWESGFLERSPNGARAMGSGGMLRRQGSTCALTLTGLFCGAHWSAPVGMGTLSLLLLITPHLKSPTSGLVLLRVRAEEGTKKALGSPLSCCLFLITTPSPN